MEVGEQRTAEKMVRTELTENLATDFLRSFNGTIKYFMSRYGILLRCVINVCWAENSRVR
jgi:hypothetical protein